MTFLPLTKCFFFKLTQNDLIEQRVKDTGKLKAAGVEKKRSTFKYRL